MSTLCIVEHHICGLPVRWVMGHVVTRGELVALAWTPESVLAERMEESKGMALVAMINCLARDQHLLLSKVHVVRLR